MVHFSQNEKGVYNELDAALNPDFIPEDIVRFSPRQFRIAPGGHQKVRLSLRKPASLPEGEYRFHVKAIRLMSDTDRKLESVDDVSIIANVGVTIPVVVRHGLTDATASLSDVSLKTPEETKNKKPAVDVLVTRQGNASTIGAVEVMWQPQTGGVRKIGRIKNLNVFTDIERRYVRIPLSEMPSGRGMLKVKYVDAFNQEMIYDEVQLPL